MSRTPFFSIEYRETASGRHPIIIVKLASNGKKIEVPSLVDTGCTGCDISLTTDIVKKHNLKFKTKQNTHPEPVELADGSLITSDEYLVEGEVAGKEKLLWVSVVNPYRRLKLPRKKSNNQEEPLGLLGRDFLDTYDALFKGQNRTFELFE